MHVDGGERPLVDSADYRLAEDICGLPAQCQYFRIVLGRERGKFVLADPARDVMVRVPGDEPGDKRSQIGGCISASFGFLQGFKRADVPGPDDFE